MPVDLPKGLTEKARQEAAEFRETDQKRGESGRDTERSSEKGSKKGSSEKGEKEGEVQEYEFTVWEDRILEVVMEAMRMAGLALAVRAIATFCLGAPLHVLTGPPLPPNFLPGCASACLARLITPLLHHSPLKPMAYASCLFTHPWVTQLHSFHSMKGERVPFPLHVLETRVRETHAAFFRWSADSICVHVGQGSRKSRLCLWAALGATSRLIWWTRASVLGCCLRRPDASRRSSSARGTTSPISWQAPSSISLFTRESS